MNSELKGRLYRDKHNEWLVESSEQTYHLHPDDVEFFLELEQRFDSIEGRIAANPEVNFNVVNHNKLTGIATYAKLNDVYLR